jgi:protocatechuate 3,4-dioxygenase beta subunit
MKKFAVMITAVSALSAVAAAPATSGLSVGEMVSAFHPNHVAGPHKGTNACPPCTYGNLPQVQIWVNGDSGANVMAFAQTLQDAMKQYAGSKLKTFVIVLTDEAKSKDISNAIVGMAKKVGTSDVCMAWLPKNDEAVANYKVNTDAEIKNTVFVYKDRQVKAKFVNLKADKKGLMDLNDAIAGIAK